MESTKVKLAKTRSHGRIGEAAVLAKCWMYGIPAHDTGGLRANFAGSDLLIDTGDPKVKRLVQVKAGYPTSKANRVYLTQCRGDEDLANEKFVADFVVFVNIDQKTAKAHNHDGKLDFEHLTFFVVPRNVANKLFMNAVKEEQARPLRNGGQRKLTNLSVYVNLEDMEPFRDGWHRMRD